MQSNMEFSRISVTALWRFERKQMTVQDQKHAKRLMIFQDQPEILKNSLFFFLSTELSWKMEAPKVFGIYENISNNHTIDE